jgi:hypothetical protein
MDRNRTPKHDSTGLQNAMPKPPGNKLAGVPAPEHVVAAEPGPPPYLAKSKQRQSTSRERTGWKATPMLQINDGPRIAPVTGYRVPSNLKEPRSSY